MDFRLWLAKALPQAFEHPFRCTQSYPDSYWLALSSRAGTLHTLPDSADLDLHLKAGRKVQLYYYPHPLQPPVERQRKLN